MADRSTRASALHDALNSGAKIAPAQTPTTDKSDWLTWTLKMPPQQADDWDALVTKLAAETGRRVRRGGRSDNGVNRRDMVEALVDLAEHDREVWDKLVDKIRFWQSR
ncbi:hypothetical protein ACFXHA_43635 [Nocardia sp. NPDC059240]|uniref:hypothetical protein n=1 Tax=Nocardia sp. NPDC059240 TaxID=3346786 RepID=UPI00368C0600